MAVWGGGAGVYEAIKTMYLAEEEVHDKNRFMYALTYTTNKSLIETTAGLALTDAIDRQVKLMPPT